MNKPKTHETVRDIKTFDRSANLSQRMKDGAAKTKETTEKPEQESRQENPATYATERVSDSGKLMLHKSKQAVSDPVHRTRKSNEEFKRAKQNAKRAYQNLRSSDAKATANAQNAANTQKRSASRTVEKSRKGAPVHHSKKPKENYVANKTIKTKGGSSIKTASTTGKTVKRKTATARIAKKSATTAGTTSKTTAASSQMPKMAFIKMKAAAVKAKRIAEAVIATVKLAIAATKSLVAIIMMGGWVIVLITLAIGLAGMFVASPFGIFFAGENDPDYGRTMQEIVAELTEEFYAQIDELAASYPHDELRIGGMTLRWNEILAVYAVQVTTDAEHGMDVVTLDEQRIAEIRRVLQDMATLTATTHTEMREEVVLDEYGEETIAYVPFIILTITLNHRTAMEMADYYGFGDEQRELLEELLDPEHMELWAMLLGGFVAGDGRVLVGNENFVPLGIFTWPLEGNWPITSRFGPRPSPGGIGSTNHLGIDIGTPTGTPILASADGTVTQASYNRGGWGFFIIIDHDSGYQTLYAHNSRNLVSAGQSVVQGQVIAEVGSTGASTGPHLHFEIIRSGVRVDPLSYFTW